MFYTVPPPGFQPAFDVVSVIVQHQGKLLLLLRPEYKSQGGKWGLPSGKVEYWEIKLEALVREMFEETGILTDYGSFLFVRTVFVVHPEQAFTYHLYDCELDYRPAVELNPGEHLAFRFVTPEEAMDLSLVDDLKELLAEYFNLVPLSGNEAPIVPL